MDFFCILQDISTKNFEEKNDFDIYLKDLSPLQKKQRTENFLPGIFCPLLKKSSGNSYLKILDFFQFFVADAPMKENFWDNQYKNNFDLSKKFSQGSHKKVIFQWSGHFFFLLFFLVLKQPKTVFDKKIPKNVGLKEPYFWPNIASNLSETMTK